jgi:NTE family protein
MLASAAWGQQPPSPAPGAPLPAVVPPNRPVIGLALQGSTRGLAHIGVLQWFEEHHIPVDRIAGTSMGALVGSLYATGYTPAELRALALSDAMYGVFILEPPYDYASFRRRQDRNEIPMSFTLGLKHGPHFRNALLTDHGASDFLVTRLASYNRQELDYNQMPIPFRCVALDLNTLRQVTFSSGPLPRAVLASIAIPGIFPPVQNPDGHYFVDGGVLDNLPVGIVRRDLHADLVIAVHIEDITFTGSDTGSAPGVLIRAFEAGIEHNVDQSVKEADVAVTVRIGAFGSMDYAKAAQLMDAGYRAAEQSRAALLPYALGDRDWEAYLAARNARRAGPGVLRQVRVEGNGHAAVREVVADMKPLKGQPISPARTLDALIPIQSNGGYSATYETFSPPPAPGSTAAPGPDTGILVRLSQDRTGPPYLLIGADLATATSNINRAEMAFRLVDQNLGGFGSELRVTGRFGYMTDLSAEYYRLLTPGGYFIEPRTGIVRQPVYIWANQKRIAERLQEDLDAGIEAGRTFSNSLQISAEWRAEETHWSLTTGSGGGPYLSGTAQTGLFHFNLNKETSGIVSPHGFRLSASAGSLYHAAGSSNAPLAMLSTARTWLWRERNIFGLTADINSYLRANVAQPYRFTLGGPHRLSASSFDEYRGTDTYLARAGYLRRLAALPTGLGQGIYGVLGYEAGEIWSPEQRAILRQDGAVSLVGATPIGAISFGVSVGDAGRRKVFFTIGRLF